MYTLGDLRKSLEQDKLSKYNIAFEKYFLKSLALQDFLTIHQISLKC